MSTTILDGDILATSTEVFRLYACSRASAILGVFRAPPKLMSGSSGLAPLSDAVHRNKHTKEHTAVARIGFAAHAESELSWNLRHLYSYI